MTRASFQDALTAPAEPLVCDGCGKLTPAWGIYEGIDDEPEGWICGACIDAARPTVVEAELTGWESEAGKYLKAQRNLALDQTAWILLAGCPYDDDTVNAFIAYRTQLHRMTVDYTVETWAWPEAPVPIYRE